MHKIDSSTLTHYLVKLRKRHPNYMVKIWLMLLILTSTTLPVWAADNKKIQSAIFSSTSLSLQQEIQAAGDRVDRKYFDFDAVINDVGRDPHELFKWVKSNTKPLPYTGVLKGAWGVLMERQGNSLDRSLLLVKLLERAGYKAELSNSTLNDKSFSIAKSLVSESLAIKNSISNTKNIEAEYDKQISEPDHIAQNVDLDKLQREIQKTRLDYGQLIVEANKQTKALIQALPLNDYSAKAEFNNALESLKDHWWVLAQPSGEKLVFDFFFDQQTNSLKELGYTESAPLAITSDKLPDALHHQVTFSIIADTINAQGEETSGVALKHTSRTAKSRIQPINLAYIPIRKGVDVGEMTSLSSAEVSKSLTKQDEWLPVLQVEGKNISQASIRSDGSLNSNAKMPGASSSAASSSLLNSMHKSTRRMSSSRGQQLAEVRLEIEFMGGGDTVKQTRVLFDFRDHISEAFHNRETQNVGHTRSESERVHSLWDKEQAKLNKLRQVCAKQSRVDLKDLWVLEKDVVPEMEIVELLSELYKSEKCVELSQALAYATPKPTGKSTHRLSSKALPAVALSEELRITRAAKFMSTQRFLILPFDIPDSYLYEELRNLTLEYFESISAIADAPIAPTQQEILKKLPISRASMLDLLSFSLLRQQPSVKTRYAITRSNLVSQFGTMSIKNSSAEFTRGIDIIENHILPLTADAKRGRRVSIQQGVFDTLLENYLVADEQENTNTASQFNVDLEKNHATNWVSAKSGQLPSRFPGASNVSDSSNTKIALYSPLRIAEEPFSAGFWLVDPKTGQTLGYTSNGRGGAIEYTIHIGIILANAGFWVLDAYALLECINNAVLRQLRWCGAMDCAMEFVSSKIGKGILKHAARNSYFHTLTRSGTNNPRMEFLSIGLKYQRLKFIVNGIGELAENGVGKMCRVNSDKDGDGVLDRIDDFPNNPHSNMDSDGDGVSDENDAFPNDPTESTDTDNDRIGDNEDEFPNDPLESEDTDGDGVGDNADAFPKDFWESADSDKDGVGDNADAFPNNPLEDTDSDGDGVGDNADAVSTDLCEANPEGSDCALDHTVSPE